MAPMCSVRAAFEAAGQQHLFAFFDALSPGEQRAFLDQLQALGDPQRLFQDVQQAIRLSSQATAGKHFDALPESSCGSTLAMTPSETAQLGQLGRDLIAQGKVAVVLMAGGQGTRLGSSAPKGCYDVGLPSGKSLFQLQAEGIRKLEQATGGQLALYVMTSEATRTATEDFFVKNNYWGLQKVSFFNQGTLPAFDMRGEKLLLGENKSSLVTSPDGNGGLYRALHDHGILDELVQRGVEHIHMYCVDNVLVKVADPVFLGFAAQHGFDVATKVVRKENPDEKVGLIVTDGQSPCVIEYSEITPELAHETDQQTGLLKLRAANIVNHYYNVQFLQKNVPQWINNRSLLPYHIAKKKVPYTDASGAYIKPDEVNGIKLEQFIFDVFPAVAMDRFGCLEVARQDEFSPLKNAPGAASDSPEQCRRMFLERGTKWLAAAAAAAGAAAPSADVLAEVSPLTSYAGEGLEQIATQPISNGQIV